MFVKLKKGKQKEILQKAIIKAGSERALSKITNIPKISIYKYKFEITNIPDDRLERISNFLGLSEEILQEYVLMNLDRNWGRIKGGRNCVAKKIRKGTLANEIEKLRQISSRRMKKWHKYMKENNPKQYHIWQYERFKKVGRGYLYCLDNEIPVRNLLEKKIGDYLIQENIGFAYEPFINVNGKAYFPDFKIGNNIIEVTEWKHPNKDKIIYIKNKLKDYNKLGYKVIFFIPKLARKFYKEFEGSIVSNTPELKKFLMPQ